jgi:prepilin signal peptidase PulO-like enzyme (type II secretory pathway)
VDFERFEIPDEISIGGIALAPVCALAFPALHGSTWIARYFDAQGESVGRFGSLVACLLGIAVGAGILLLIGAVGSRVYGRDAMGLGDVKLLGGAGGFIGPGGCLVALMIASLVASVAGVLNVARFAVVVRSRDRARGRRRPLSRVLSTARILGRYVPFGPYLALGIGIVLLYWDHVRAVLGWGAAA